MEARKELEEGSDEEILSLLSSLESRLKTRVVRAPLRSPETLFEEIEALDLVLALRSKLLGKRAG